MRVRLPMRAATAACIVTLVVSLVPALPVAAQVVPVPSNLGCDPIDPKACLLPFPNDFFTTPDPSTDTGLRVNFSPAAMPRNGTEVTEGGEGKPVDPAEWNRNDGFSPGSMVMTYVEGLDLHVTWGTQDRPRSEAGLNEHGYYDHRDHIADIGLYQNADAPIVIINASTGERHPFWSELDLHPGATEESVLILRPAVNFEEGTRYVVGLRNLKRSDGSIIERGAAFDAFVDGNGEPGRQAHFDQKVFPALQGAGIAKEELYLAWDFTVASERNLAERILTMRDDAFGRILGDTNLADGIVQGESPKFTVDKVESRTDSWTGSDGVRRSQSLRRVHGRIVVPNYLDRIQQTEAHFQANSQNLPVAGTAYDLPAPGSRLYDDPTDADSLPDQNPVESTVNVPYVCEIPLNGQPNNVALYGHGLLGTRSQVGDIKSPRRAAPFAGCAVDWWGMSSADLPTVAAILADFSSFPSLPDRAQQGFLNFMFLGRAAVHPEGFVTHKDFQQDGRPLLKVADETTTPLYYDGNSQGGIMGGSLVAVSPDIQRGILGVPGMNYSTLLNRSVDWEGAYAEVYYATYQDPIERQVGFALLQMLWDRGETNGYAHHMTDDPLPNTPPHDVMLQVAWSDHQVTNVAAEVEARTIGAPIMVPGLPEGRHWEADPYFADTAAYPYKGSALVYWDSGNATPPNGNLPADENGDPHGHPRDEPAAAWQEAQFLLTGWMVDVCGGGDYLTRRHPANQGPGGEDIASCREPEYAPGSQVPDPSTHSTTTAFTPNNRTSGQYSDATVFEVSLTDDVTHEALAGEEVTFTLGDGARSWTATTGSDGVATVSPVLDLDPGTYTLRASYAGGDGTAASSTTTPFEVTRDDSALTLTQTGRGAASELVAFLSDADSGTGLHGRRITFLADGEVIGTAVTDGGRARFSLPSRYRSGRHRFEARFDGDTHYLGATATR